MKPYFFISEQLKFIYNKWILLTILCTAIFIPFSIIILNNPIGNEGYDFIINQISQSFYLGQVGFIVISVLYFGQEFKNSTLRTSLLCAPNRLKFIFYKIIILFTWEIFLCFVISFFSLFVIRIYYNFTISVDIVLNLFEKLFPVYIAIFQISLIVFCLTAISKSIVFSLSTSLAVVLGLGQMLLQFSTIFVYLPVLSVNRVFIINASTIYPSIKIGLLLQSMWSFLFVLILYLLLKNRIIR